jgi:predicted TIM-barrel fold metal-dependent hydrolase
MRRVLPPGTRVVSADDHRMEPEFFWEDRLPARDRDRAPKVRRGPDGFHFEVDGRPLEYPGFNSLFVEGRPGYLDPAARLRDMDAEGIEASVIFHGRAMALFSMEDKDLMVRCFDVYNEWAGEWSRNSGGRLVGVGILPTVHDVARTRDYIAQLKAWGLKAMQIPTAPRGIYYNASSMEPLWDAIEESGIPVSFHVSGPLEFRGAGSLGANITRGLQPFRPLWALLTFSGVLERHPGMKVVFTEGGASWAASAIHDADNIYRKFATDLRPKLAHPPSYYWHHQCYATFMDDPIALELIDRIGEDNILWSVDYPHPEGILGEADAIIQSIVDRIGPERARKVLGANAIRLWKL